MKSFFSGLGTFLRTQKRLWLLPLLIFFFVLALLLFMVSQRSALAPFIYSQNAPEAMPKPAARLSDSACAPRLSVPAAPRASAAGPPHRS